MVEEGKSRDPKQDGHRLKLKVALLAIGILLLGTCILLGTFRYWASAGLPEDAPRIGFSLDDGWLNQLGITRATYDQAMARAGGRLITLEPEPGKDSSIDPDVIRELLRDLDGLLLSGGGDVDPSLYGGNVTQAELVDRRRDDFEMALIKEARRRGLPILGVCRGCQILNVAYGGTLRNLRSKRELKENHFNFSGHSVTLVEGSILSKILKAKRVESVASFHGQAVDKIGEGLRVAATADDGVVEAIETANRPAEWITAVQWHPEMAIEDERQIRIFREFVKQAMRARKKKRMASPHGKPLF